MTSESPIAGSVAAVRGLFSAAACSCALVDEDGATLTFVAADGVGAAEIVGVSLPVGRGIAGWAALSGQPIAVRDVTVDPRFARDVAEATSYVPTSVMAAPLLDARGEVLGVLEVLDARVDESSDWTLAVLGTLAWHVGALVVHERAGERDTGVGDGAAGLAELGRQIVELVERRESEPR